MKIQMIRSVVVSLTIGLLAEITNSSAAEAAPDNPPALAQISQPIDDVLRMHKSGVEPSVIIAHLNSNPQAPGISAADVIELREAGVSLDVMRAVLLRSTIEPARLSADDIIQLHEKGVPGEIIGSLIHKGRKSAEAIARASEPSRKNPTYLLTMPRTSSTIIIPHRPYYYSPYYRGYHGPRYYGPTLSYGFGYGYHRSYGW